jgi:multiple sugar transport system permease protein
LRKRSEIILILGPALAVLLILMIYPMIYSYWISLHSFSLLKPQAGQPFIGLENYIYLLTEYPNFWISLQFTSIYVIGTIVTSFFIGLGLALILNEEFRGKNVIRSILILPLVLTPIVVGFNFRFMYSDTVGVIPYFLRMIGIQTQGLLGNPITAEMIVISVDVWQWTPFVLLILLSGLQMIPKEHYEAAEIDGAGSTQKFISITLPLLKPAILIALMFRTLDALRAFDIVYVMTSGGPGLSTDLLTVEGYRIVFQYFNIGLGTAFAILMAIISTIIATIYLRYIGTREI